MGVNMPVHTCISKWSNKTKQAIQLGYANRIIYSDIFIIRSKEKNRVHLRN